MINSDAGQLQLIFPSVERLATGDTTSLLVLEDRAIHVWGFSLDGRAAAVTRCRSWLSEEECARADRFVRQDDHIRYVLAHGGLRALLARYTGLNPAAVAFQMGPTGKPALKDRSAIPHPLRFNLSHSHGRMLIAVARERDVGADLEQIRDRVEVVKLAERFYTPAEYERLLNRSDSDQTRLFYRYWVAKEAVLKGQEVGLRLLQQCEILTAEDRLRAVAQVSPDSAMQSGWTIQWVDCGVGWVGAISAQGDEWSIRTRNV